MRGRKYTVLIADRQTGVVRRLTVNLRAVLWGTAGVLALPILIGLGAKWSATSEIARLQATTSLLELENTSYRSATGALTNQIASLQAVMHDLGVRSQLDPGLAKAMKNLPAVVRSRAVGGGLPFATAGSLVSGNPRSPDDTFGVIRDLLEGLSSRLRNVQQNVEQREALAASTPSIWPTRGWLTARFGERADPFDGGSEFHEGIDISANKGTPVFATADGVVESAAYNTGGYGNLIVLRHGFGLETRYGHLSRFAVKAGDRVERGQVIGYVGETGRATGYHLHYEILANGELLNPLHLLTQTPPRP
ncbi:MAG TPA: M23 family metallopeptidase [Vicinamibacterales bacterium]|jgi:murein DD-endopeptidase MepM/ murein hydrolase activator NlpD